MRVSSLLALLAGAALARAYNANANSAAGHAAPRRAAHGGAAKRSASASTSDARPHALARRYDNAPLTYFPDGMGACGKFNTPSDFIVALNAAQYGNGEHCFEMVTITYKGKSVQAQITDECPGCDPFGLDLSKATFEYFDDSLGELWGSWEFSDAASTPKSSSSAAKPSSTSTASTSTSASTTSSSTGTTSASSSASAASSGASSASATATRAGSDAQATPAAGAGAPPAPDAALVQITQAFMQLSGLAVAAVANVSAPA